MLRIYIANKSGRIRFEHGRGPIEIGRDPRRNRQQVIEGDLQVSNDQLRIEEHPEGHVRIENLSQRVPMTLANGTSIGPRDRFESPLPVRITVGETLIEIDQARGEGEIDSSSLESIAPPVQRTPSPPPRLGEAPTPEEMAAWLERVVAVQQSAASSPDFYPETARAVVEMVGLDYGLVLLRDGDDGWRVVARHGNRPDQGPEYSRTILGRVGDERQTFYGVLSGGPVTTSQVGVGAVVAAPILADAGRRVVGVVYGARSREAGRPSAPIRPLEAQLVQVLASAVGTGLARLQGETEAARRLVQFEQFFSADLARELDRDPTLLDGRDREVTILFSDIRGFSRFSEKVSPREVCALAGDVMDRLTGRVREHGGTIVSYQGDGLLAMWNAPADQPDHATLACLAALAIRSELPGLDASWSGRIGRRLELGIGINTGKALVGNTGSRSRFMYGPQGHTVNLASRIEGATKQVGVPILIAGSTRALIGSRCATRRVGQFRVAGIEGPVTLHELYSGEADAEWAGRRDAYEQGLTWFESGRWAEACRTLYPLLAGRDRDFDPPTLALASRCLECLKNQDAPFDPVAVLDKK